MPQLSRIGPWTKVPNGSSVRVSAAESSGRRLFIAKAFVLRSDGLEVSVPDSEVQPGPLVVPLEFPHLYSVQVDLHFDKSATAVLNVEVISPGNNVVPQDGAPPASFQTTLQGTEGATIGFTFFISTGPT